MANYVSYTRTNYFCVKDPDALRDLVSRLISEDEVEVWEEKAADGTPLYGFGVYGSIAGMKTGDNIDEFSDDYDESCEDYSDEWLSELQKIVADGDAVIIKEVGHEKLRYVCGSVIVVTKDKIDWLDLNEAGLKMARELLGDPKWETRQEC